MASEAISTPAQITLPTPKSDGAAQTIQSLPATKRAKRWAMVKHLDENSAARREVQAQNEAELIETLRRGPSFKWLGK
jgi:hypothetical protein